MSMQVKYVHTNLIARDWRALARFYTNVFGCLPLPPERRIHASWLSKATGVPEAGLEGIHLRLPGHGEDGPTLEIFTYTHQEAAPTPAANRPGFAHIAFSVNDVQAARAAVLDAGGGDVGQIVTVEVPNAGEITVTYVADPEGNIIELQHWT
jgi:catechol 2,3-dioxygenase-like lactoylglutathione lyase family enzyme